MGEMKDDSVDFAYSSNCLEHIGDPAQALKSWIRIVRPGGIVFFTVPDETLYEHDKWPSTFNKSHLWSFTMKTCSQLPKSIHIQSWLKQFDVDILSVKIVDTDYDYSLGNVDQTQMGAEAFIEVILRV
jgi:ubiquinone/menaquinone biosynthesis C-methylase UbiE